MLALGAGARQPDHSLSTGNPTCITAQRPDPECFEQSGALESTSQVLVETVSLRYVVMWRKGLPGPAKPLELEMMQSARHSIGFCAGSVKSLRDNYKDELYSTMTSCVLAHLNLPFHVDPVVLAAPLSIQSEIATEGYVFVSPAYYREDRSSKWWQRNKKPLPSVTVVILLPEVV